MNGTHKYDLHVHSIISPCSLNGRASLVRRAKERGLDGMAITDHDSIENALKAGKENRDKRFEIIVGEEISTNYGHLIGLYLKEPIRAFDLFEAIEDVKRQGGLVIIPHPFQRLPWGTFRHPFDRLKGKVDGLETFNSRTSDASNALAKAEAVKGNFAQIDSSDAHFPFDIGNGYTIFEGGLRSAIKGRRTRSGGTNRYGGLSNFLSIVTKAARSPFLLFGKGFTGSRQGAAEVKARR